MPVAGKLNVGLALSNGSLLPGLTQSPTSRTAKRQRSAPSPMLDLEHASNNLYLFLTGKGSRVGHVQQGDGQVTCRCVCCIGRPFFYIRADVHWHHYEPKSERTLSLSPPASRRGRQIQSQNLRETVSFPRRVWSKPQPKLNLVHFSIRRH